MGLFSTKGRDYIDIIQASLGILTGSMFQIATVSIAVSIRSSLRESGWPDL